MQKSYNDEERENKNFLAVYLTALENWTVQAGRLAVSSNRNDKLETLKERLGILHDGILKHDNSSIGEVLVADRIIDNCDGLESIEPSFMRREIGDSLRRLDKRLLAMNQYITDRQYRLKKFVDPEKGLFTVKKESDISEIYDGIMNSISSATRTECCSYLGNEAASLGRNVSRINNLMHKNTLDSKCRATIRSAIGRSRTLSDAN